MTHASAPVAELSQIRSILSERLADEWAAVPPHLQDVQVLLALGNIRSVSVAGLHLFECRPSWEQIGIATHGDLPQVLAAPPTWRLVHPHALKAFRTLTGSARALLPDYGPFLKWLGGYYITHRAEPALERAFAAIARQWRDHVEQLCYDHDRLLDNAAAQARMAAREAFFKLRASHHTQVDEHTFTDTVEAWARGQFPSPERITAELTVSLAHALPAGAHPSERIVAAVLGVKEEIAARTALNQTQAEQARLELEQLRAMHARRTEALAATVEQEMAPITEAIQFARDQIGDAIHRTLAHLTSGKRLSPRTLQALESQLSVWRLIQQGEGAGVQERVAEVEERLRQLKDGAGRSRRPNRQPLTQALEGLADSLGLQVAQIAAEARVTDQIQLDWLDEPASLDDEAIALVSPLPGLINILEDTHA